MHYCRSILICTLLGFALQGCRKEETVIFADKETLPGLYEGGPRGMYLLNEGNMGSNKATIDFLDFQDAVYLRNIYGENNPNVVKELGDVGNDLQIYGNRLYAVINCSHKVEVMDSHTCKRIGQVDIPNCRYIVFADGKAYVSSYVGPVSLDKNAQLGAVYEVDTATLTVTNQVSVGFQPEQLAIVNNRLYVANSGGYRAPDYDSTISVVDLTTFRQIEKIPVALNLHGIQKDRYGQLWITSRGNYHDVPPCLLIMKEGEVTDTLDIPCANFDIAGDTLYYYTSSTGYADAAIQIEYGMIDVRTHLPLEGSWITDNSEQSIKVPYAVKINPYNKDVYVTDAKNYVSSGMLYCYNAQGRLRWKMRTGDIPAHMCLLDW